MTSQNDETRAKKLESVRKLITRLQDDLPMLEREGCIDEFTVTDFMLKALQYLDRNDLDWQHHWFAAKFNRAKEEIGYMGKSHDELHEIFPWLDDLSALVMSLCAEVFIEGQRVGLDEDGKKLQEFLRVEEKGFRGICEIDDWPEFMCVVHALEVLEAMHDDESSRRRFFVALNSLQESRNFVVNGSMRPDGKWVEGRDLLWFSVFLKVLEEKAPHVASSMVDLDPSWKKPFEPPKQEVWW
jgi:hypothetical protein